MAHSTAGLSGEAMLLYGSRVIACACSELWLKYHTEIRTDFNLAFKGLKGHVFATSLNSVREMERTVTD